MALVGDRLVGMLECYPVAVIIIEYIIILLSLVAGSTTTTISTTVPTCLSPSEEVVGHHAMDEIKVQVSHQINIIIDGLPAASIAKDTTLD